MEEAPPIGPGPPAAAVEETSPVGPGPPAAAVEEASPIGPGPPAAAVVPNPASRQSIICKI